MLALPDLPTLRLTVRPVFRVEPQALLDYQIRNRAHLTAWEPAPDTGFFTLAYWLKRQEHRERDWQQGRCAAFALVPQVEPSLVIGSVSLSQIQRGIAQTAMLGYGIDSAWQGQSLMREALEAVIAFAFGPLRLHRLQANYQVHNQRSAGLLARLGFQLEGRASAYLFLNGQWQDHVMAALLNPGFTYDNSQTG